MKYLLIFFLCQAHVFAQSEHNEFNNAVTQAVNNSLRLSGLLVSCETSRSGRWSVSSDASIFSPEWSSSCQLGGFIYWPEITVNGSPAVRYRVFYTASNQDLVSFFSETNDAYLPISDPKAHNLTIEGYDSLGNSVFSQSYEISDQ